MMEAIMQAIQAALEAAPEHKLPYEEVLELIPPTARVNAVNMARNRFDFKLELENGAYVHYVMLKS